MAREIITDIDAGKVEGGSIIFNEDLTTCGRDRNDQYNVLNYKAVIDYISSHRKNMSERTMLKNMVGKGYLSEI